MLDASAQAETLSEVLQLQRMPFTGHLPKTVWVREASNLTVSQSTSFESAADAQIAFLQGAAEKVSPQAEAALRAATAAGRPMLCVDLGSMPMMGFVPDSASFVSALVAALRSVHMHGLLLTGASRTSPLLHPNASAMDRSHCCRASLFYQIDK